MAEIVVLGGGISGLATAYHIQDLALKEGVDVKLTLVEKEERLGGKIMSVKEEGFLCEAGPAAFPDNTPETLVLARDLNLEIFKSNEAAKKRFIYTGNRLEKVPETPGEFFKSKILSWKGKLRVLLEPFTKPAVEEDETIAGFGERHLGIEAEEKLISALVVGIFAGDSRQLSLKSCFPVMHELEKEGGGSLFKAMFKRMKKAKARKGAKISAIPYGNLASFNGGLESLTEALEKTLQARILKGKTVERVEKKIGQGYEVLLKDEKTHVKANALVIALPAYAAAEVLKSLDAELSKTIGGIPYVPASVVCLGYHRDDVQHPLDGFGFLIPKKEGRRILGCRWDSSTFEERAPSGKVLLWTIVGGAINPGLSFLEDDALLTLVREELKDLLGLEKEPVFTRIFRHEKAIPQYMVGHEKRLEEMEGLLENHPGLFMTGNAFRGIGIKDCVKNAAMTARMVVDYVKGLDS